MKEDLLKKVKEALGEIEPSAEIYLYGSRARQDSREDSDWDFLILVDGVVDTARTDRIRHRLYEIEWETDEVLSSIVRNRLNGMARSMKRFLCGKILNGKDCHYE